MCHLKVKNYQDCLKDCSDVLDIDATSVKALFRQGKCYLALDKWDAAKESFRKVLELDDGNMEARRGLQSVRVSVCVKINQRVRLTGTTSRRWRERLKFDFHTGQNASPKGEGEEALRRQEAVRRQGSACSEEGSRDGML
jgi:tetratricopeptide (TPR) repeat protein